MNTTTYQKTLRRERHEFYGYVVKYGVDVVFTTGNKVKADGVVEFLRLNAGALHVAVENAQTKRGA